MVQVSIEEVLNHFFGEILTVTTPTSTEEDEEQLYHIILHTHISLMDTVSTSNKKMPMEISAPYINNITTPPT